MRVLLIAPNNPLTTDRRPHETRLRADDVPPAQGETVSHEFLQDFIRRVDAAATPTEVAGRRALILPY